jgi:hypothetical protein
MLKYKEIEEIYLKKLKIKLFEKTITFYNDNI